MNLFLCACVCESVVWNCYFWWVCLIEGRLKKTDCVGKSNRKPIKQKENKNTWILCLIVINEMDWVTKKNRIDCGCQYNRLCLSLCSWSTWTGCSISNWKMTFQGVKNFSKSVVSCEHAISNIPTFIDIEIHFPNAKICSKSYPFWKIV